MTRARPPLYSANALSAHRHRHTSLTAPTAGTTPTMGATPTTGGHRIREMRKVTAARLTPHTFLLQDLSESIDDTLVHRLPRSRLRLQASLDDVGTERPRQSPKPVQPALRSHRVTHGVVRYAAGIPAIPAARSSSPNDNTFPRLPSWKTSFCETSAHTLVPSLLTQSPARTRRQISRTHLEMRIRREVDHGERDVSTQASGRALHASALYLTPS